MQEEGEGAEEVKAEAKGPVWPHNNGTELLLAKCNGWLRRALHEAVEARFPQLVTEGRGPQVGQRASS